MQILLDIFFLLLRVSHDYTGSRKIYETAQSLLDTCQTGVSFLYRCYRASLFAFPRPPVGSMTVIGLTPTGCSSVETKFKIHQLFIHPDK